MIFKLPKPPSINNIYAYTSRGGIARSYITRRGVAWFDEAGYLVNTQRTTSVPIKDKVYIIINLFTARAQDVDNINKPILDLLAKHMQVILNDQQVYKLTTEKHPCKQTEEHVEIEILSYNEVEK